VIIYIPPGREEIVTDSVLLTTASKKTRRMDSKIHWKGEIEDIDMMKGGASQKEQKKQIAYDRE